MPEPQASVPGVVSTIAAKCRRCYNCVRSCPAKAIRVHGGQAEVLADRCIGCGNCLKVCGQDAKQVQSSLATVQAMLAAQTADSPVIAVLAPSYPAAFDNLSGERLISALRKLGFAKVMEVGFGAELVALRYAELLASPPDHPVISSPCPALVSYVEKYLPDLTPNLAPLVSPMVALGLAIKQHYYPGALVVFIGPCVAKKMEMLDPALVGAIDAVMTFQELDQLFEQEQLIPRALPPSMPDGPLPHYGSLFPVSGGLLKAAAIRADLMDDSIVVVEGPERCLSALHEVQAGNFKGRFLDLLFCEGCIAGPSYAGTMSPLARRERVTDHVRRLCEQAQDPALALSQLSDLNVSRGYRLPPINVQLPNDTELRDILAKTDKFTVEDELNCGACGYATCRDKAVAVYQGLAEPEMCLPYLIDQMQINLEKIGRSKEEIEKAREQAARAQELASMGQLAADIAHEISTPLTQVVVFAQLLRDSMAEDDPKREDLAAIVAESLHARDVMAGLKGFARQRQPLWEDTNLKAVINEALEEANPQLEESQVELTVDLAPEIPQLVADANLLQQVIVNLINNSLDAITGPGRIEINGRLSADRRSVELQVRDTGCGIPPNLLPQIMQPFVTTKTNRRGAGLGLAVAHGVMRAHGGELLIDSKPGHGTTITMRIPITAARTIESNETIKVLLVDDDPDLLEIHRLRLAGMGFKVMTAERSDEAIDLADREIPDAFVLDLMMEKMDSGARLARAFRRDPRFRTSPIVLLTGVAEVTGFDMQRNPREVMDWMKIDAWYDKPAPIPELAATIRRLLAAPPAEDAPAAPAPGDAITTP